MRLRPTSRLYDNIFRTFMWANQGKMATILRIMQVNNRYNRYFLFALSFLLLNSRIEKRRIIIFAKSNNDV